MTHRAGTAALLAVFLLMVAPDVAAQCAMCRTALQSPEGQAMAEGFQRGVLLLLAAPFGAVGTIGVLLLRARRRLLRRMRGIP